FFQAEDGIRDLIVTGVQTCALPICRPSAADSAGRSRHWPSGSSATARRARPRDVSASGAAEPLRPGHRSASEKVLMDADAVRTGPAGQRFLAGDPLRGLAALGVAVYHAGTVSLFVSGHSADLAQGWPGPFGPIAGGPIGAGAYGVDIFFVLSGYLISRPFVAAYAEGRRLPRVLAYLRNRVLRIVPAYWVALAVVVLVAGSHGRSWADAPRLLGFSEDW